MLQILHGLHYWIDMLVSENLQQLIAIFAKLPGLGPRSARRIVLHLIKNIDQKMHPLAELLKAVAFEIKTCGICGNIDTVSPCNICSNDSRDRRALCVVEHVSDLWALERTGAFSGLYHVLGGTLSALEGRTPETLSMASIPSRIISEQIDEVIIATNATLEGQTTAHYLADLLAELNIKVSRLAHGIPVGAELDYMDEGTINLALKMRNFF